MPFTAMRTCLNKVVSKIPLYGFSLLFAFGFNVNASGQNTYTPDVTEFDGTNGYAFPATNNLTLANGGTIEFWLQCDWINDPGYDPVILSNAGQKGALYMVSVLGDRSALSLQAGDNIDSVPFDCKSDQMNYVAIVDFSDSAAIMINGRVEGTLSFGFADVPSAGLWIGSADGTRAPFKGALAGLRIWDIALDRSELVKYSTLDITQADNQHPDLNALVAKSDFRNDTLEVFSNLEAEEPPTPKNK